MVQSDYERNGEAGYRLPRRKYEDEDVRPTSQKELFGWYAYGWAAEVFMICGVASFIPIALEQLSRENGFLVAHPDVPCPARPERGGGEESMQCAVSVLGWKINTASFAMYSFSISVLLQAAVIVSMSGAADHGRYRKTLLLTFAFVGAVAMMLYLPVTPGVYMFGALLAIVSNVCAGAAFVLLNSYLPVLVRNHPAVRRAEEEDKHHVANGGYPEVDPLFPQTDGTVLTTEERTLMDSTAMLLPASEGPQSNTMPTTKSSPASLLSTKISAYGIGIGYFAAVLFQLLAILIIAIMLHNSGPKSDAEVGSEAEVSQGQTWPFRVVLFLIGVWWAVFSIPPALFLRPRPGPPLPQAQSASTRAYLTHSWAVLFKTVAKARHLKDVVYFLCAWFLLSDALATVSGTAILFAKTEIGMPTAALGFISVISTLFGVMGAFFWSFLSRRFGWDPVKTIIAIVALFELIPLYCLLAYIPAVKRLGYLGLQAEWEIWVLAAVYGLVLGGVGAHCRSLFSELVPKGSEAAFFALYAITDKGSSVFGPAVVGAITDRYGSIRPAFVFLSVLVALPGPVLWLVDVKRGKRDADAAAHQFGDAETATTGDASGEHAEQIVPLTAENEDEDARN